MTCKEISSLLSEYYDGELDAVTQKRVEEHLASCKDCVAALEIIKELSGFIQTQAQLEVPADFKESLSKKLHQVAAEKAKAATTSRRLRRWFADWRTTSGLAACLVLLVVVVASSGGGLKHLPKDSSVQMGQAAKADNHTYDQAGESTAGDAAQKSVEDHNPASKQAGHSPLPIVPTAAPKQDQEMQTPVVVQDGGQQPAVDNSQNGAALPTPQADYGGEPATPSAQPENTQDSPVVKVASEPPADSLKPAATPQPPATKLTPTPQPPTSGQPAGITAVPTPAPSSSPPPTSGSGGSSRSEAAATGSTSDSASYAPTAIAANTYVMRITRFGVADLSAAGSVLSKYGALTSTSARSKMFEIANANYQKAYNELAALKGSGLIGEENIDKTAEYNSVWNRLQDANANNQDGSAFEKKLNGIENLNNVRYIEIVI